MRALKTVLIVIASLLIIISPIVAVFSIALITPPKFNESFVGALDSKIERLDSIEEDKIVVIGGSSVAFGVNSPLIEKYTGMPVVNFGLYASLGTKLMLDLSRESINEGDIVVIAPEMDAQTLSLYFNADSTLRALDGSFHNVFRVSFDDSFKLLASGWEFASEKLKLEKSDTPPDYSGVYSRKSFNEYLDIAYPREYNIMSMYYDPNLLIKLDKSIVSDDFIDYLNDYISYCKRRGAEVYFSWCPMNSLAVTNTDRESILEFASFMEENIDATFISNIEDYILPPEYFYDTNFHVNDAGMLRHSVNLTMDIRLELGISGVIEAPEGQIVEGLVTVPHPELPFVNTRYFDYDENEIYFTYLQNADGSYVITGLSELGKTKSSLTVPLGAESYVVSGIAEGAIPDTLEELIIPEGTNLRILKNGCFKNASSLERLVIYHYNDDDILPPFDFVGVKMGFKVYIPENSNYPSGYHWGHKNLTFERIEK